MPPPASTIPSQNRLRPPHRQHSSSSGGTGSGSGSNTSSLKLPSLPRFHPANFPSQSSSAAQTPSTNPNSPQPPPSPYAQQRQYSEAQRQLYLYQRELLATAARNMHASSTGGATVRPVSPRLNPLGSPGPVTPLELEGQGDYLVAGARSAAALAAGSQSDLVEKLIQDEVKRAGPISPGRPTSVGGC
ncbi:uncharacterized protein K452DRAFT_230126 [Aplosporella prunicola CBS 121167]|uniref:Uncharacterized protein n=1 Tax=Aplosporella prunicola CBS 121167 TaxID=1176127 RepID=A0A6A6BBM2_9PEZI|nr:uncharacterized protein K452DRAFT_230126 [Aplosporella prunicola CBS 121167]KAF2140635.1 hypothetical protein K452DRAFT_230126 [Aplosporella prunicola CBS 121167]